MDLKSEILQQLKKEKDEIDEAISVLEQLGRQLGEGAQKLIVRTESPQKKSVARKSSSS